MRGTLDHFIRKIDRSRDDRDEWPFAAFGYPITVWPSITSTRRVLLSTKQGGILGQDIRRLSSDDTTVMFCSGFPSSGQLLRLRFERELGARELFFIGDLDPVDLITWMILVAGEPIHGLRTNYVGVGDAWITLCKKYVINRSKVLPWGLPVIRLSSFESNILRMIRVQDTPRSVMGTQALALLDAGYKLELEGASNPAFYRQPFSIALQRMLRRRVVRNRSGGED